LRDKDGLIVLAAHNPEVVGSNPTPATKLIHSQGLPGGPPEALLLFGKDLGKHFTRYPAALVRLQLAPVLISSFRLREVEGFSATETVEALGIHSAGRCVGAINSEACTNQDGTKDVRTVWISDDVLVAYTDGITEAENRQPKLWGRPTLDALLKSCSHYRRRQQATPGTIHLMDARAFVGSNSEEEPTTSGLPVIYSQSSSHHERIQSTW
jgi:Stage II sporulation protein E (SpoIIE)